jgi:hypothetical protein
MLDYVESMNGRCTGPNKLLACARYSGHYIVKMVGKVKQHGDIHTQIFVRLIRGKEWNGLAINKHGVFELGAQ